MKFLMRLGLLIIISGLAILFYILNPVENSIFPKCIFHSFTGYYCPGCGSQRAIHSFLHLSITNAVRNNILFLPALAVIIYHFLHQFLNKKFNLRLPNILYMKLTPWVVFGIIILFWILRNIPVYPFYLLAPE